VNLILVGYRGSGKSTVGRCLAKQLGFRFVDLDSEIVRSAQRSIRQIFDAEGEAGFRQRERRAIDSLAKCKRRVIALGGGAVDDPETRRIVTRLGRVVWLRAPAVVLWARIRQDPSTDRNRPDLTPTGGLAEVESLLSAREPAYREAALHVVDTVSSSPEQIAEAIGLWFRAKDSFFD